MSTNSSFDRIVLTGSLIPIAYQKGMQQFLFVNNILLKDFLTYTKNLAEIIKEGDKRIVER